MPTSASPHELSAVEIAGLTAEIRNRRPRQSAITDIQVKSVPVRTCYETMTKLSGPVDAVLDYAAWLFSEENSGSAVAMPPLSVDEAHTDFATGVMTLVLSRGSFTTAR